MYDKKFYCKKLVESVPGVSQSGALSPILLNIYLDKLDKELDERGFHFVRYADYTEVLLI